MDISLKEMAANALHFGHPTHRWNPRMKRYLYSKRHGIHIFDLKKTADHLVSALIYLQEVINKGKVVLFVGTKQQARHALEEIFQTTHHPIVTNKWMPGLLTNFKTIKKRIQYFVKLKEEDRSGELQKYTKKEQAKKRKEIQSLSAIFGGVEEMDERPDALFIIDVNHEKIAVREAKRMKIPVIAIVDSNSDPAPIDYVIPANDDAVKSINYIVGLAKEAILGAGKVEKTPKK